MFQQLYIDRLILGSCLVLGLVAARPARGEIVRLEGVLSAEVQEFGGGGSSDAAFEELGETADLPLQVVASLLPPEGQPITDFAALAIADLRDPTASLLRNPGEIGLETNLYSRDPEIRFTGEALVNETRGVIFSPAELPLGFGQAESPVFSSVFASGAIVIWSEEPGYDLTGLFASLQITVTQQLPEVEPTVVFEAGITANGQSSGQISVATEGGLVAIVGGRELLSIPLGFTGVDLNQELDQFGVFHVVLIAEQELVYEYAGVPNVEFDLDAQFEAQTANLPGGTGVGAVYGRSFQALAQAIEQAVGPQSKGLATQAAVNEAMAEANGSGSSIRGATAFPLSGGLCGAVGPVFLTGSLGLLLAAGLIRRLR